MPFLKFHLYESMIKEMNSPAEPGKFPLWELCNPALAKVYAEQFRNVWYNSDDEDDDDEPTMMAEDIPQAVPAAGNLFIYDLISCKPDSTVNNMQDD